MRYKYGFHNHVPTFVAEQESQTDSGLNWDSFKYRNYDYAIYRFMTADPLAQKYPGMSPFTCAADTAN